MYYPPPVDPNREYRPYALAADTRTSQSAVVNVQILDANGNVGAVSFSGSYSATASISNFPSVAANSSVSATTQVFRVQPIDGSGSIIVNDSIGYVSASAPPKVTVVGGFANMSVPSPVTQSNAVNFWVDEYGRMVFKGFNNSLNAVNTYEIAPGINQYLNVLALSQSTAVTNSLSVDVSLYTNKTVYISASCTLGTGSVSVFIEHSPDGVVWWSLTSRSYASSAKDSYSYTSYMPYIQTRTENSISASVTTYITAKSA